MLKYIISIILFCSCASVKKTTHSEKEQKTSVSNTVSNNNISKETDLKITGTTPVLTKPDSVSMFRYTANSDTANWEQNLKSGSLNMNIKSTPRKDAIGNVTGRDLTISAKKDAEEVQAPIDIHANIKESDKSKQESTTSEVQSKSVFDKAKDVVRANALFSIGVVVLLILIAAIALKKLKIWV